MVLDLKTGNEWQYFDKDGELYPWFTKPSLDILVQLDLKNKKVWEWGLGASTCWFAKHTKGVFGVDSNKDWLNNVNDTVRHYNTISNTVLDFETEMEPYVNRIDKANTFFDIISVDGIFRNECTIKAIEHAIKAKDYNNKHVTIFLDNWLQNSVEIASPEVQELVNKYPHKVYRQENHEDWATCIISMP